MMLTAGLPDMHSYHTHGNGWNEPTSPGPVEFLSALVEELCGFPVAPEAEIWDAPHRAGAAAWVVEEESNDTIFRTVRGRCGTPQQGFRWASSGLADDSSVYTRRFT